MIRLHLVGFTTDLKNLIFSDQRGARSGGFVVSLDARLKRTLDEVERLEGGAHELAAEVADAPSVSRPQQPESHPPARVPAPASEHHQEYEAAHEDDEEDEAYYDEEADEEYEDYEAEGEDAEAEPPPPPPKPRVISKLTPKEIQSLLRQGKTEEQVAEIAETDVDWVQRFSFAILAERAGVIEAVKSAQLTKPRLGVSAKNIGESVLANVAAKQVKMTPAQIDDAWRAVRTNGLWQVSFEYVSRGQKRVAEYSFDPASRTVEPLNDVAMDIGWRSDQLGKPAGPKATASSPRVVSGVSARTARTAKAARASGASQTPGGVKKKPARPAGGTSASTRRGSGPRQQAGSIRPLSPEVEPPPLPELHRRAPAPSAPGLGSRIDVGGGEEDDEFIIRKPKNGPSEYDSLPKVWRPRRRV